CRHCGTALPEGALFCGECGRAVDVPAFAPRPRVPVPAAASAAGSVAPVASVVIPGPRPVLPAAESELSCPQCGEPVGEDDVFCGECGFVLSVSEPRPRFAPRVAPAAPASAPEPVAPEPVGADPAAE